MSKLPPVEIWIEDGRLLTNRPDVFAKQFDLPDTVPVDGIQRVSYPLTEDRIVPVEDWDADDFTDAVEDWLDPPRKPR